MNPVPARPGAGSAARLAEILRVDHAGEIGAVAIYRGQRAVMDAAGRAGVAERLGAMQAHEERHLAAFDRMLVAARIRPTILAPVWRAAGFALGAATALIGETAAHACTEAVEDVIEAHYAGQAAEVEDQAPALAAQLDKFRGEELDHRAEALASGAREASAHALLTGAIRTACRIAIKISEKV